MSRQQPQSPTFDEKKLEAPEHFEDVDYAERQPGKPGATEASKVLAENDKITWSIKEERALLRRIDLWVCLPMCITYFIQQLDKSSVSYAAVFDLREATHLKKQEYPWLTSIVYVAQLILQPLSSYALVVFPVKYWVMFNMISWGIVTCCTAAAHNFAGLITARFFLGAFEATILPSFVMITQMWWSRREQSYRTVAWQVANSCAAIFGPLLSYGVGHIRSGIHAYQSIFIFMGAITLALCPLIWYLLPNSPEKAKFLSKGNDRYIAIERLRANNTGTSNNVWKWDQCRECFCDPKTYGWAVIYLCTATPSGGFGAFGGIITKGFGFTSFNAILMQMPTGAIQIIFLILSIWITNRIKLRFPVLAVLCLFPIGGAIGLLFVPRDQPKSLLGCYYVALILGCLQPLLYSWANLNAAGHTKKVCTTAVMFVAQCTGNIIGPQVYLEREAPVYRTGLIVDVACWAILCVSILAMASYLKYLNRKQAARRVSLGRPEHIEDTSIMTLEDAAAYKLKLKEALAAEGKEELVNEDAFEDLTDWMNPDFIYVL